MAKKKKSNWLDNQSYRDYISTERDMYHIDRLNRLKSDSIVDPSQVLEKSSLNKKELSKEDERKYKEIENLVKNGSFKGFGTEYNKAVSEQISDREERLYPYKLGLNSLATAAELGSAAFMLAKGARGLNILNNNVVNGIVQSDRAQVIANAAGAVADGYQLFTSDNKRDDIENSIELTGDVAGVIGGTNVMRNSHLFNRYGRTIDNVLDAFGYGAAVYDGVVKPLEWISDKVIDKDMDSKREGGDTVDKQDYIYSRLTEDYQLPPKQAIAIIANLTHESGLNTEALGDKGASYGIQQWKGPRREALEAFSSGRGHEAPDLDDQIDFLMNEYNNGKAFQFNTKGKNLYRSKKAKGITDASDYYQFSKAEFDNASSLYDATIAWNQGVGRPHKKWAMNDRRYNIAQNLAKRYDIKDDAKSLYFDQGYSDTQIESNMLPNLDIVASKPEQIQSDFMTNYGNNIVAQVIAVNESNNKVTPDVKDIEQDVQIYTRQNEEDRRAEFLNSFLPNIQLKVKGVTQIRG